MKSPVFALIFSILTVLVACSNDSKPIFDEAGISVARTEAAPTISNRGLNSQHGAATSIVNGERIQVSGSLSLEVQSLDLSLIHI